MKRILPARLGLALAAAALSAGFVPAASPPTAVLAQSQDLSADPRAASLTVADLRPRFTSDPSKSRLREDIPGITIYEADFTREQTPENFKDGPVEIKSLVARTASTQQAAEQFTSSRQALVTANPPWKESTVAKLGDEATGLTMIGTSSAGDAVAHLYLFRRGAMVVGITVAGLVKPTKMAEAEALAATVLTKIDPSVKNQRGQAVARPLNPRPSASPSAATGATSTGPSVTRMQVAKTDNQGVRLRAEPSRTASVAAVLPEGTVVEIVGEDRQGDGLTWKNVRTPDDKRGWVSNEYLVPAPTSASGSSGSGSSSASVSAAASGAASAGASASTASTVSSGSASAASAGADVLTVDVSLAQTELRDGEQTLTIKVTQQGKPVAGAVPTVHTTHDEQPAASATDADGNATITWTPTGEAGFVGVGVSVTAPNGATGVGSTYFNLLTSR